MTTVAPPPLLDDEDLDPAAVAAPAAADYDPDAPHGRNPRTGKPYKRSPEWRAGLADALARGRQTQAKAPGRKSVPRRPAGKAAAGAVPDYRPGLLALAQVPAFILGAVGRYRPAFALDAATVKLHAPNLAEAIHQTALVDDRTAAILEKVLAAGPYAAILGALVPMALQIAANHQAVPVVPELGILTPDQLVEAIQ